MRGSDRRYAVGVLLAVGLTATACTGDSSNKAGGGDAPAPVPPAQVAITPAQNATKVRPDKGVVVKAAGGTLDTVRVTAKGKEIVGAFNAQRTEWRSKWTLAPSTEYQVNATAKNPSGTPAQAASTFKTLKPEETVQASLDWILEGNQGRKYGVGTPIVLNFDREVRNKEQVEKALEVKAAKPVEGAWRWVDDQQVVYRTKSYWPAHQKVTLTAHLAGVRAAKDVYGTKDLTRSFQIGASRISTIDLKKHRMTVKVDGRQVRKVPVSGGNGSTREFTTTSGVHLAMEKDNPTRMISPGRKKGDPGYYDLLINYAVRFSNSGEYLHQTSGEEYCLGKDNCSHGCVRQPASDARWFYRTVQPGDVIVVKGTRRDVEWNNGWSFWEMPWNKWKQDSSAV
ncbi:L,D-transpeptidase [Actinomadura hibisca]|uniref:L,D-transpeptidase n=1 Tax=Actinomadura hibisca TaxID=68565 RepID=UPI00082B89BA|nr:Ig-like domain-containing protein [Actinomadura hibisca]